MPDPENKAKAKRPKRQKKQKNIRSRLMRGIIFIMLLTVLIPILAYNNLPEWAYYLAPATRLWLATEELHAAYQSDSFLQALQSAEKQYDATIEFYNANDVFTYSTRMPISELPQDLTRAKALDPDVKLDYETTFGSLVIGDKGFLVKEYNSDGIPVTFLDCYQYFEDGSHIEVYVQVSQMSSTIRVIFMVSFVFMMFSTALALTVIYFYIGRLTKPINNMCTITEKMAQLNFSEKCPPSILTEIDSLSQSINVLSDALDTALTDLQQKNKKLLEDIENERTIDNLRQTFISGISHELKTPIAIIQGYAEGAKMFYASGNTEAADSYCDIIVNESQRMNAMIMKLLEITKYSSGAYEPQREDFEIAELTEDWFSRNDSILREKGITGVSRIPKTMVGNGDKLILSSVVNNYLSNAVSHADGEKRIETYAEDVGDAYRVYIFNTGAHIADKDIDKIWTSFYRADKALSRSQGRFGLGLAIVAAIQDLHGQAFGVENVTDGVRFWFDVKKAQPQQNGENGQ